MPDISTILGAAMTVEFEGSTYKIVRWDRLDIQKAYIEYLKRCGYDELFAGKANGSIPPLEYQGYAEILQQKMAAGAYGWGGSIWWESMGSPERQRHLAWLTLKVSHPDITLATVYKMMAVPEKYKELDLIFEGMVKDPNCRAPALPAI
jgi:hypothetical protein